MEQVALIILVVIAAIFLLRRAKSSKKIQSVKAKDSMPFPPPGAVDDGLSANYDYQDFLYANGLDAERFASHQQFVTDTYSNGLLLGSSKDIVRDDPNDINPYLGLRRPDYNVVIGSGARQVPTEYRDQLADVRAPSFV